jgi:hypothetical protein
LNHVASGEKKTQGVVCINPVHDGGVSHTAVVFVSDWGKPRSNLPFGILFSSQCSESSGYASDSSYSQKKAHALSFSYS